MIKIRRNFVSNSLVYAIKTLKETFRSYEKLGLIFAVPVVLLVALAFMYGDQSSVVPITEDEHVFDVGVINLDNISIISMEVKDQFRSQMGTLNAALNITGDPLEIGFGACFVENVNGSQNLLSTSDHPVLSIKQIPDIEQAKIMVQSRTIDLCFIITENFSRTLLAGINYRSVILTGINITNDPSLYRSETTVELIGDYSYSRFSKAENILTTNLRNFTRGYMEIELPAGKFELKLERTNSVEFTEFHTYIPGFLVFVLLMSVSGSAGILALERSSKTLDRLKISGYSAYSLLIGISITQIITTGLQILVYILTVYLIGFPGHGNPLLVFLVGILALPPILGLGLISAVIFEDEKLAMSIPGLGAIPISFLTGSFLPLPEWTLFGDIEVWHLNPLYSASEAVRKVLFLNYNLDQIYLEIALLLLIGTIVFLISALVFRKKVYMSN